MPSKVELSDKQKEEAVLYVKRTGYWVTRLAKFLGVDFKTLKRIIKADKDFSNAIEAAEGEFVGNVIAGTVSKAPWVILARKYREEFPTETTKIEINDPHKRMQEIISRVKNGGQTQTVEGTGEEVTGDESLPEPK